MTGDLRDSIATLAETFVLADPGDLQALGALHAGFKALGDALGDGPGKDVSGLCARAQTALERLVMGESADAGSDRESVSRCISLLQAWICDGRRPAEAGFAESDSAVAPDRADGPAAGRPTDEAHPVPSEGPREGFPMEEDIADGDPSLTADFVRESLEHLENADLLLMGLESDPGNAEAVNGVFRAFHTIKGVAGFLGFKMIQALAHGTENLLDMVRCGTIKLDSRLLDVTFMAVEALRKRVQWVASHGGAAAPAEVSGTMWEALAKVEAAIKGEFEPSATPVVPEAEPGMRLGEILVKQGIPAKDVAMALATQKKSQEAVAPGAMKETVKVEADRLDRLLDAIGELVIAETMIFQAPEIKGIKSQVIAKRLVDLDKITRELQKMGTSLRMVPIRPVFQKMAKLARDLARKAGKNVEFQCRGEETELDKTVVDKIGDPLVHMVRNSLDHGIESDPARRAAAGKPAQAKVLLHAFQKGGNVCIRIQDDGKGLDREAILRKARERGLLHGDGADLPDQEVWRFIFEAGFSTAAQITEISGRGVGMDVVRRNIEELRGRIEIESVAGQGTTFSIWLPLTLAIIDGMIVRVGRQRLVFPTLSILRIVPVRAGEAREYAGRGKMLMLQGELIPLFDLAEYVPGGGDRDRGLAVIVESGNRKSGLMVEELLGQQQVVIKGLGESLKQIPGLAGGAILSDGTVGMILDVDGLMQGLKAAPAAA